MVVNVLVLDGKQLVCASARADAEDLLQLAMNKVREELPAQMESADKGISKRMPRISAASAVP
jgi:hypothetical protein